MRTEKDGDKEKDEGIVKLLLANKIKRLVIEALDTGIDGTEESNKTGPFKVHPSSSSGSTAEASMNAPSPSLERMASNALANYLIADIRVPQSRDEHHRQRQQKTGWGVSSQLLKLAQWQRDMYLVGESPPSTPSTVSKTSTFKSVKSGFGDASNPATSPAQVHLQQFFNWFLPSQTVLEAVKPTIIFLPSEQGPLRKPVANIVASSLPMSQTGLDGVMKRNLSWVLTDPDWRTFVKGRIVRTTYQVGSNGTESGETNRNHAEQ